MRLLAVETSGTHGGIALMEDGRVLDEVRLTEGLRHARDLIAAIKEACDRAGWGRRADVVALSIGPGSFTGIRIAVTFAKFVAWDAGAKVVAVPTLRVLAENAPADCGRIVPILDAKRGGLFAGIFERRDDAQARRGAAHACGEGGMPTPLLRGHVPGMGDSMPSEQRAGHATPDDQGPPQDLDTPARRGSGGALSNLEETFGPALIEPEALARRLEAPALILGPGVPKGRQALAAFDLAPEELWAARPAVVARLGWELHELGRYADPLRLEPVYIRPPEAQEIWERKHGR
jgi:tRNA A37 threonylcarbamoyladenosine modification protein TsaB